MRPRKSQCFSLCLKTGNEQTNKQKPTQCYSLKAVSKEEFPCTHSGVRLLVLLRPSMGRMRPPLRPPAPTLGSELCLIQFIKLNVNFIQKHLHRHTQNNGWPNVCTQHGPVKLTSKISRQNYPGLLVVQGLKAFASNVSSFLLLSLFEMREQIWIFLLHHLWKPKSGSCILFLKVTDKLSTSEFAILHSDRQRMRVPLFLPHQQNVLSYFWIFVNLIGKNNISVEFQFAFLL